MRYSYKKIIDFIERHKKNAAQIVVGMKEDWDWTSEAIWNKQGFRIFASEDEAKKIEDIYAPRRIGEDGVYICGISASEWATPTAIAYDDAGEILEEEDIGEEEEEN